MKKFGRKLVLSGLALAATAATLSTSTYAWYVTNTTADVGGGTAATAGTAVAGNLLVAQNVAEKVEGVATGNYIAGAYSNKISLKDTYTQAPNLNPVTKCTVGYALTTDSDVDTEKTYYTLAEEKTFATATSADFTEVQSPTKDDINTYYVAAEWMNVDGKVVAATSAYQEVSFWVLATDANTVNFKTTIANATETFAKQRLLNATEAPTNADDSDIAINSEFYKDAVEALRFEISTTPLAGETTVVGVYDAYDLYKDYEINEGAAKGGDANAYYAAVMGKTPVGGATVDWTANAFSSITVTKAVETKVTIRIWLEGTDADCFDSCIGQKFTFDFDLSI